MKQRKVYFISLQIVYNWLDKYILEWIKKLQNSKWNICKWILRKKSFKLNKKCPNNQNVDSSTSKEVVFHFLSFRSSQMQW